MRRKLFLLLLVLGMTFFAFAEKRSALVISNYDYSKAPIDSGKNDGDSVSISLQKLGFDVVQESNLNQKRLASALKKFTASEANCDIMLFYYRGYAVQSGGKNYLLPTETNINSESDIPSVCLSLDEVLEKCQSAGAKKILIFLDACDENPWQKIVSDSNEGLAYTEISPEKEILLMFSQALNQNTLIWKPDKSLFTQSFVEELGHSNVDVRIACSNIASSVKKSSGGNQIPWINSTLTEPLVLKEKIERPEIETKIQEKSAIASKIEITKTRPTVNFRYINPKNNKIHPYMIAYFAADFELYKEVLAWAKSTDRDARIYRFNTTLTKREYETNKKLAILETNKAIKDKPLLDAIAWANAYSEFMGLAPVYYDVPENVVFRDATAENPSIAAYLNQGGFRFPLKDEFNYAVETKQINGSYSGYLLAKSSGDLSTYADPTVKVEKNVSGGLKFVAAVLNPVLGLGSYIEGDISGGIGFTLWQGLGLGTAYFGYYVTEHWKETLANSGRTDVRIDYTIPNIIVGSGLGVYGLSALIGLIRPFTHPPMKKQTFSISTASGGMKDVAFDFEPGLSPSGDLAMCLTFAW